MAVPSYIVLPDRVLFTANIVEVKITEARERRVLTDEEAAEYDYPADNALPARPLSVAVVTTATTSSYDDGGNFPDFAHTDWHPYVVNLVGGDAGEFLAQLRGDG